MKLFDRPYYRKNEVAQAVATQLLREIYNKTYEISNNNVVIDCPFCKKEKHLYISIAGVKGLFLCFRCNTKGRLDVDFPLPVPCFSEKRLFVQEHVSVVKERRTNKLANEAYAYLQKRGLTEEQIAKVKPFVFKNERRVYFPMYENGGLIFAVGRALDERNKIKYKDLGRKTILFFEDPKNYKDAVILVEGVFDALAFQNGVAILGKYLSLKQELRFHEFIEETQPNKICVCLDPDAIEKAIYLGCRLSTYYPHVYVVKLPSEVKDPWDYKEKASDIVNGILNNYPPGIYYVLNKDNPVVEKAQLL